MFKKTEDNAPTTVSGSNPHSRQSSISASSPHAKNDLGFLLTTEVSLYNMTQDGRHVIIVDLRPKGFFDSTFIRDSFNLWV